MTRAPWARSIGLLAGDRASDRNTQGGRIGNVGARCMVTPVALVCTGATCHILAVLTILTILAVLWEWEERSSKLTFAPATSQHSTAIRGEADETRLQVLTESIKKIGKATGDVDVVNNARA